MKKLQLQNVLINNKINVLSLKGKTEQFILYKNITSKNLDDSRFNKMEESQNFSITQKKKMQELKINIKFDEKQKKYCLFINNSLLYFIKNIKNIITDDNDFKIIQFNGSIYENITNISNNSNNSLVDSILNNSKPKESYVPEIDSSIKIIKTEFYNEYIAPLQIEKNEECEDEESSDDEVEEVEIIENPIIKEKEKEILTNIVEKEAVEEEAVVEEAVEEEAVEEVTVEEKAVEEVTVEEEAVEEVTVEKVTIEEVTVEEVTVEEVTIEEVTVKENILINELTVKEEPVKEEPVEENILIKEDNHSLENNEQKKEENIEVKNIVVKELPYNEEEFKEKSNKILFEINKRHEENNLHTSNKIVEEKIDEIVKNKNSVDNNLSGNDLDLEKIINDFNKLFTDLEVNISKEYNESKKNELLPIKNDEIIKEEIKKYTNNLNNTINSNKTNNGIKQQSNYQIKTFNYQLMNYSMYFAKITESVNLNFANLYNTSIPECNNINNISLCIELRNENLSYLTLFFNQKYLINKIDNSITLINLSLKRAQILKNKDVFKIGNHDYLLLNNCTFFIPMINKKNFDNNYGTSFNFLIPRL